MAPARRSHARLCEPTLALAAANRAVSLRRSADDPPLGAPTPGNPIVFFDVSAGGTVIGTIEMELKVDVTPKTCENFKQLCTGESASSAGGVYKVRFLSHFLAFFPRRISLTIGSYFQGSPFHRIIPNFMCQGGDFNGTPRGTGVSICTQSVDITAQHGPLS